MEGSSGPAIARHDPDDDDDRGSDVWAPTGESIFRSGASAALPPVALPVVTAAPLRVALREWPRVADPDRDHPGRWTLRRAARIAVRGQAADATAEILVVLVLGLPLVVGLAGVGG